MTEPASTRHLIPLADRPAGADRLAVSVLVQLSPVLGNPWLQARRELVGVVPAMAQDGAPSAAGPLAAQTAPFAQSAGCAESAPVAGPDGGLPLTVTVLRDNGPDDRLLRYDSLIVELFPDEAESYYYNLMAPSPRCFVVFRPDGEGLHVPFLVTVSFDLANSYAEGDDRVDDVALDPALYGPVEMFVLTHYAPEERTKRQRKNWKQS